MLGQGGPDRLVQLTRQVAVPIEQPFGLPTRLRSVGMLYEAFDTGIGPAPLSDELSSLKQRLQRSQLRAQFFKPGLTTAVVGSDVLKIDIRYAQRHPFRLKYRGTCLLFVLQRSSAAELPLAIAARFRSAGTKCHTR